MRKIIIVTISLVMLVATGCLKDTPATDLSHEGTILELIYPPAASNNGVGSGLEYFGGGALTFPSTDLADTVTFYVNIAGTNVLPKALSVTVAPDPNALLDNFSNDSISYIAFPDSDYTILNATKTIPAGSRLDTFQVVFYPYKFDPTKNFMLPLTATNSGGYTLAGNFGHLYLHTIGNPIAGTYNQEWIRYNSNLQTGTPAYDEQLGSTVFAPVSPTTISVVSGSAGLTYLLSFVDSSGVLTDFTISFLPSSITASGVTVTSGPFIVLANPATQTYTFNFTYNNSAGAARNITDKFTP